MNQQDLEVKLLLMEERQKVQANHLKDVDECCGKLKGNISEREKIQSSQVLKLENKIETQCKNVELDIQELQTASKGRVDRLNKVEEDLLDIHRTQRQFFLGLLSSLIIALISWLR